MGQKVFSKNTLFYGDNLPILKEYFADETVDLIYLDPPFNSNRSYNILYKDESGLDSTSQIRAFEDTWHWDRNTEEQYRELSAFGNKLSRLLDTLVDVIGRNQMTAYLIMMSARLLELHRILKPTGSLYLHCDSTASHYLKLILDMIFNMNNFQNEIIWKRTSSHSDSKRFPKITDTLFFYSKSNDFVWNKLYGDYDEKYIKSHYNTVDKNGRRFQYGDLVKPKGSRGYFYTLLECPPPKNGWRMPESTANQWLAEGKIEIPPKGNVPRFKRFLDEMEGLVVSNLWTDIPPVNSQAKDALDYPTQKPIALLERIIQSSSNKGDVILDPFCGCGTAVHAAQKLERTWIGIDITPLATAIIKSRLFDSFQIEAKKNYDLIGEPTTVADAKLLAKQDRYQFQWWALGLLPARPFGGQGDSKQGKKGADKGIDGIMTFKDTHKDGLDKRIIVQVKSGKVKSGDIRDLLGTVEREKNAVIGVFVTLEEPTKDMNIAAMESGYFHSDFYNRDYPKIQIFTIEQLLAGDKIKFPGTDTTLKQAPREQPNMGEQENLLNHTDDFEDF
jgi:site-specific DNA-methyltransferase (adenine-specific)